MIRRVGRRFLPAAIALLIAACASAPKQAQGDLREVSAPATLQPGDAVHVRVWRQAELSGEFPVAEDGTIAHPLLREVRVAGLPAAAAEEQVRAYLEQLETSPQFVVQPLLRVSVGGEVRQPSLYRLPPATSIAEAVALAGGASERGRLDRVRLFRDGQEIRVDLTRPEVGGAQSPIRSGDQIYVERKSTLFRDYIAPVASIAVGLVNIILRYR